MTFRYRHFTPPAQFAVRALALLTLCALVTWFGIEHAKLRMEQHAARQRVCAAELAALRRTSTWAQKAFCSLDSCACVEILAGRGR